MYNTFCFDLPRLYAGTKLILFSLDKVLKKNKIKDIVYFNDFENEFLEKIFYKKVFEFYSRKNKLTFNLKETNKLYVLNIVSNFIKKIYYAIFIFQEFNLSLLLIKIKKKISEINFFNKKTKIVLEPACDLNFSDFNTSDTRFIDLNKKYYEIFKLSQQNNENFKKKEFKNLEDIFISYLTYRNNSLKNYFEESYSFFKKKINLNNVKQILWGSSPSYLIRNLIILLKKKYKVYGTQHGASYFLTQKDHLHKDSDYTFCNNFYSYGVSKKFIKKKYLLNTKLIENGCFKDSYIAKTINDIKTNRNNLLYIPINLNNFFKPNFQSSQTERFLDQVKICRILDSQRYYNSYVKILPNTCFGKLIFNYYNLEVNPICYEIKDFKNLSINSNTVITAFKKIKPKIIICDHFSTPVYELSNTDSEIILILDKINYPKRDVLEALKKRFFIAHSSKDIYPLIKKIHSKKEERKDEDFYRLFYENKLEFKI